MIGLHHQRLFPSPGRGGLGWGRLFLGLASMKLLRYSWCGMQVRAFQPVLDFYTELLGMPLEKASQAG